MPRIGCGDEGLQWKQVKRIMQQIFAHGEYPIEIMICEHDDITREVSGTNGEMNVCIHLTLPFQLAAPKCQITEAKGNLFSAPENFALVHSVSADFAMCAGISLQFRCKYGQVDELKRQQRHTGNVAVLEQGGRYIYNLVTKERAHEKCTYTALYYALLAMREHMVIQLRLLYVDLAHS